MENGLKMKMHKGIVRQWEGPEDHWSKHKMLIMAWCDGASLSQHCPGFGSLWIIFESDPHFSPNLDFRISQVNPWLDPKIEIDGDFVEIAGDPDGIHAKRVPLSRLKDKDWYQWHKDAELFYAKGSSEKQKQLAITRFVDDLNKKEREAANSEKVNFEKGKEKGK